MLGIVSFQASFVEADHLVCLSRTAPGSNLRALAAVFPGARNQRATDHGHRNIQSLYTLRGQGFVAFRLSGFDGNDQAAELDSAAQLEAVIYTRLISRRSSLRPAAEPARVGPGAI